MSMKPVQIKFKKLHPDAIVPQYQNAGDSGFDFFCVKDIIIDVKKVAVIPTGIAVSLPDGFEIQIRLRSSTALTTPLILANAPGTIDSGYRGEIGIIVRNIGEIPCQVKKGDRIAQGVLSRYFHAEFEEASMLDETIRGTGGFGSTGKSVTF